MNAHVVGQLAGMQKSAMGTRSWLRFLSAIKKQVPELLNRKTQYHGANKLFSKQAPERMWKVFGGYDRSGDLGYALRDLTARQTAGRSLRSAKALEARRVIAHTLGLTDPTAQARSVAPRAVPFSTLAAKRDPASTVWRGTSIGKERGLAHGEKIWGSGEPATAGLYSLHGGEQGAVSQQGRLLLKHKMTGQRYTTNPFITMMQSLSKYPEKLKEFKKLLYAGGRADLAEGGVNAMLSHQRSPVFETTFSAPRRPLAGFAQAWRVFGDVARPEFHSTESAARALNTTKFVPISRQSMQKWLESLKE